MSRSTGVRQRKRGSIDPLPSGALRVRVYAGVDPVSGKAHYLTEVVPSGPKAAAQAEKIRTRLLAQVDDKRNPRTSATVNQLLDRYLEVLDVEPTTRDGYERYLRIHVRPLLGELPISRLDGEILDSFYAQLRTCRAHCRGRQYIEHRTHGEHDCDDRCGVKVGLSETTSHGNRPGQRKARLLLEVLRDGEADVLRFAHDLQVPPTSNQAERDLRPAKLQQKISGRLTSEQRTKDRYRIRGYVSTAIKHGHNAIDVLRQAILGQPWMPPEPTPT